MSISCDYMRGSVKEDVTDLYDEWENDSRCVESFSDHYCDELERRAKETLQFEWGVCEEFEEEDYEDE